MSLKQERAETTAKYEAGELVFPASKPLLLCHCRSFRFSHEPEMHKKLRSDMDWRTPEERGAVTYAKERVR